MKRRLFAILFALVLCASFLTACSGGADVSPSPAVSAQAEVQTVGEGAAAFTFEVTGADGAVKKFDVRTGEETVGAALVKLGLIAGDTGEYGLYVKTVDGETADYDKDKAYWAFFAGGEYAAAGADATAIETGKTYAFVYTKD